LLKTPEASGLNVIEENKNNWKIQIKIDEKIKEFDVSKYLWVTKNIVLTICTQTCISKLWKGINTIKKLLK